MKGYEDDTLFPANFAASGSDVTTVNFIKRIHNAMWKKTCSRCGQKGHERSACWYLSQMNLEARRLPDNKLRRRYA